MTESPGIRFKVHATENYIEMVVIDCDKQIIGFKMTDAVTVELIECLQLGRHNLADLAKQKSRPQ